MTEKPFNQSHLLIVDDDPVFTQIMQRRLTEDFEQITIQNDLESAQNMLSNTTFHYALLDLNLAGSSGLTLLKALLQVQPDCKVVMLTGYSSITTAVDAIKLGAINYLAKPATTDQILAAFSESETKEVSESLSDRMSVKRMEWEHIQAVLKEHDGNISATAKALNMHRRTLQRKLQKTPVQQ